MTLALPLLGPERRTLLIAWARGDAPSRAWTSLLKLAGPTGIELAEDLAAQLEREGLVQLRKTFVKGSWRLDALVWNDLSTVKAALGLGSRETRRTARDDALAALSAWSADHPDLADAVEAVGALNAAAQVAERHALLRALVAWRADQRTGTRRDFELVARGRTKSLTATEWRWLQDHVDLPAHGIEGFVPLLWLAGALRLEWPDGRVCDLAGLHVAGLVADDVVRVAAARGPACWWLIENRASFERQAASREPDIGLVWLPGRPPGSWVAAVDALLRVVPAPARISADPDPAGVEIALTAGARWSAAGLPWTPWRMGVEALEAARQVLPLDAHHDPQVVARLASRTDLPPDLQALVAHWQSQPRPVKAEQEGWL